MRRISDGDIKVGDTLYSVSRDSGDGKLHLWSVTITEVVVTHTPTGKPRKPIYKARGKDRSEEFEIDPRWYCTSAVHAVNASLASYFKRQTAACTSPEERMLRTIFGDEPDPMIAATALVDVIYDLKNYHALFAEAFALDDAKVQKIGVEEAGK